MPMSTINSWSLGKTNIESSSKLSAESVYQFGVHRVNGLLEGEWSVVADAHPPKAVVNRFKD